MGSGVSPDKKCIATISAVHFTLDTRSHNRKAGVVIFTINVECNIPTAAAFINEVVMSKSVAADGGETGRSNLVSKANNQSGFLV